MSVLGVGVFPLSRYYIYTERSFTKLVYVVQRWLITHKTRDIKIDRKIVRQIGIRVEGKLNMLENKIKKQNYLGN